MSCWALVPVKARAAGKQRLAPVLDSAARVRLVRDMLDHVLAALSGCELLTGTLVVSPERDCLAESVPVLQDPGTDLNVALASALSHLQGRRTQQVLIVAADLPLLTTAEINELIEAGTSALALAPDLRRAGTNALCMPMRAQFTPQFGADSLARHMAQARQLGLSATLLRRPGLACDVDEPHDLDRLGRYFRDPGHARSRNSVDN